MIEPELFHIFKERLGKLFIEATSKEDGIESLSLSGEGNVEPLRLASEIMSLAIKLGVGTSIRLLVDEDHTKVEDIEPYLNGKFGFSTWNLILNKLAFSKGLKNQPTDSATFIFFDSAVFLNWTGGLNPLKGRNNIFVDNEYVEIFLEGLQAPFGGPRLAIRPLNSGVSSTEDWPSTDELPSETILREHVHLVPYEPMSISPCSFALTWGDLSCEAAAAFRKMSAVCVAAGLSDVIYGSQRVVVKGVKHLETALYSEDEKAPDKEILILLQNALSWVYEERIDTRKRLISDRLCLEAENEESFVSLLVRHINSALKQSKDQYRFVILDRKDEYAKELRSILKDLREQADLYAEKVRGLISGLLRDTLAAFVFVALSLSSRLGTNIDVLMSDAGILFFKALAVYFIISALLQSSSSFRDLRLSDKELAKWAEVTREYFSKSELDDRIQNDLRGRRWTFYAYLILITGSYLAMAYISWNMQLVIGCLLGSS
tara:strand:+ start:17271 stop:18737 length:1467 start_codon:yes stop_codon:yes gene_type:complete